MYDIPQWLSSLLAAAAGGLLVGLINWKINKTNKEFDERRHIMELKSVENRHLQKLMFDAAIANWKQECELAIELHKKGRSIGILPLDSYIVHMIKLSEVLINGNITKDNIKDKLKEITAVTSVAAQYAKDLDKPKEEIEKQTE